MIKLPLSGFCDAPRRPQPQATAPALEITHITPHPQPAAHPSRTPTPWWHTHPRICISIAPPIERSRSEPGEHPKLGDGAIHGGAHLGRGILGTPPKSRGPRPKYGARPCATAQTSPMPKYPPRDSQ